LITIASSVRLLSCHPRVTAAGRAAAALALTVAIFPLVGGIFGQREHLAVILALPLLAAATLRAESVPIGRGTAIAIGIAAGLGLGIKPHYVLVWLAILVARAVLTRVRRPRLLPEDVAVLAVWVGYVLAVVVFTPGYFELAAGSARAYLGFGSHSLRYILFDDSPAIGWYVAVVGWWLLTPDHRNDSVGMATAAAGAGFLAAVAAQHKGWSYHFYPVNACAFLLAVSTSVRAWPLLTGRLGARLVSRALAGVFVTLVGCFALVVIGASVNRARGPLPPRPILQVAIREAVERQDGSRSISVLSSQIRDAQPLLLEAGLDSHPPYSTLWVPLIYYRSYAGTSDRVGYRTPAEMSPGERDAFDRVAHQLARHPPDLLLVESPVLNEQRTKYPGGFDFLAYYGQDPRVHAVLGGYRQVDDVGGIRILRRNQTLGTAAR
jgi:hypothetical protein